MYYYEFFINGNRNTYQSKFKYSEIEVNNYVNEFIKNFKKNSKFYNEIPRVNDIIQHLVVIYGIIPKSEKLDYEFSYYIEDLKNDWD